MHHLERHTKFSLIQICTSAYSNWILPFLLDAELLPVSRTEIKVLWIEILTGKYFIAVGVGWGEGFKVNHSFESVE